MSRLTKKEAQIVKDGLMSQMTSRYRRSEMFGNEFGGIWINDAQKRGYLRRLAEKGLIMQAYGERGWYKWYSYKALELPL